MQRASLVFIQTLTGVLLAAGWCGVSSAQQSAVVPADRDQTEGSSFTGLPFSGHRGRHQIVIASSRLIPGLGDPWTVGELWFRRDTSLLKDGRPITLTGGAIDIEVSASATNAAAEGPSEVFALNRGNGHGPVYTGTLTLPTVGPPSTSPAPWSVPDSVRIPFTRPVQGTSSQNLLLEIVIRKTPGQPEPGFWIVDEEWFSSPGLMVQFGTSCSSAARSMRASGSSESLRPGSSTMFMLWASPRNALCMHFLGSSDLLLFGQPLLPMPLDVPGAPGCMLYTDPFIVSTHVTDAPRARTDGETRTFVHWPLSPAFQGIEFFSQWIVFEPGANRLGLTTSNGVKLQLSSGPPTTGVAIVTNWDPLAGTGVVRTHLVPVMRLVK